MWATFFNMLSKFLNLTPRYLIAIAAFAAFLLYGPDRVLKDLSVYDFAQNNRPWLGLCFVISVPLLLTYWSEKVIHRVWNAILNKKAVKKALPVPPHSH